MAKRPAPNNASVGYDLTDLPETLVDYPNYNEIVDDYTTTGFTYFCRAPIGTSEAVAGWQISRFEDATGELLWADADANFDNVAADRASLTYALA